jgi:hypothetical protein
MATSGSNTGALRPYTAQEMIEEATSRCGIKPVQLTSEIVEKSLDQLNLIFPALMNRGIQLWKRQRYILPFYVNSNRVNLPDGINVVSKVTRRTLARANNGVPFSDTGGDPALAFDDDLDTVCQQTDINGSIGMVFDQPVQITTVGVKYGVEINHTLFVDVSDDGINWQPLPGGIEGVAHLDQWVWFDLDGSRPAKGWRIRAEVPVSDPIQAPVKLVVQQVFFGHTPSEIVIEPWNLDEYNAMPNKTSPGTPVNYYQQRDLNGPYLLMWPVTSSPFKYDHLCVWAQEYLDTISAPTQDIDVPRRWYDAITAMLARRLCRSLAEADVSRYKMLRQEEAEEVELAEGEERDPSPTNYDMGLGAYTA